MSNLINVAKQALEALEAYLNATDSDQDVKAYDLMEQAITALRQAIAEAEKQPDWKALVLNHNADCDERCNMDRCGYKPYYEYSMRRCPDCPVHVKIDVDYTHPPKHVSNNDTSQKHVDETQEKEHESKPD